MSNQDQPKPRRVYLAEHRPRCPKHRCAMICGRSAALVRYYYCPVHECRESRQVERRR